MLFSINTLASNVSQTQKSEYWLEKTRVEAREKIKLPQKYIDFDEIKYFAKHITDDVFYKKLCEGKKMSKFLDEDKWDCIYDGEWEHWQSGFTKIQYSPFSKATINDTHYDTPLPLNEDWFAALDEALLSGELGKIKNVSFLSYDVDNRRGARVQIGLGGPYPEIDESLWDNVTDEFYSAWFAYIESDKGEYLFPCVIEGNMGIENGRVYELYECAEIMNANMYVVEDFYAELVEDEAPNVWYFLAAFVIVLSGICVIMVLVRKKKKKGV